MEQSNITAIFGCTMGAISCLIKRMIGLGIKVYRYTLSPLLGRRCRFYPSCSHYAEEAIETHGLLKGLLLTGWRLLRCQPFCRGGIDPVPASRRQHEAL